MISETDRPTDTDATATLDAILALIATRHPRHMRALADDAAEPPARELSVIDRARMTLLARSQR